MFHSKASGILKLAANDEDDDDAAMAKVTKRIVRESKELTQDKFTYQTRINVENVLNDASPTLLQLMSSLTPKLDSTLQAGMVGNIVTSLVTNRPTLLQIALGIAVRNKSKIETLYDFGVTCSYDETLRFKSSAAHAAAKCQELLGISHSGDGLVQAVADNFDARISSQNGLQSTHALAILLTQVQRDQNIQLNRGSSRMKRIKKEDMMEDVLPDVPVQRYRGPNKPDMPANVTTKSPLPLKVLARQHLSVSRAKETDFLFLKAVVTASGTPEFNEHTRKKL